MKKLTKKSGVLFAIVMALGVLAVPAMASAAGWTPSGTYTVTSSNLALSIPALGAGSQCDASFDVDADGSSTLTITSASFTNCFGTGAAASCGVSATANNLDWTADDSVAIAGVDVDVAFSGSCPFAGNTVNVSGTLGGGSFDNSTSTLTFSSATGLSGTTGGVPLGGVTVTGDISDPTGVLMLA